MKFVLFTTNLLMSAVLSRFAISKLAGWEISVNAFIEMAQPLGINPTFFRLFTGFVILSIVIAYLSTAIYSLFESKIGSEVKINFKKFANYSNLMGLLTMIGALLAELFLRVQPKWPLVYIAIAVIILSIINMIILKTSTKYNVQCSK
ncbi:hypothetical protein [Labilibaculum sp.]|uniref:hypothetical protein n=1 Tax=Labilibaculum sp. TaxID=2060723 RepID=UPI00356183F0